MSKLVIIAFIILVVRDRDSFWKLGPSAKKRLLRDPVPDGQHTHGKFGV